jgi:hypothetical protein
MTAMDVDAPKGEAKDEQTTTTTVIVEDVPHAVSMRMLPTSTTTRMAG